MRIAWPAEILGARDNDRRSGALWRAFAMAYPPRLVRRLCVIAFFAAGCHGCTLVKPVVGLVTAPVLALSGYYGPISTPDPSWSDETQPDGGAAAMTIVGYTVFGAFGGLVTGVMSDWAAVTSCPTDPTENWWDPFANNRGERVLR